MEFIDLKAQYQALKPEIDANIQSVLNAAQFIGGPYVKELEEELDRSFFRTSRSHIVNLHYVRKITRTQVTLKDGDELPLSRKLYEEMNRAMIHYF